MGTAWPLWLLFPCVLVPCHTSYFILCLSLISQLVSTSPGPLPQGGTKRISPLSPLGVSTLFCPDKQAILVTSGQLRFYLIWLWNAPYTTYHVPRLCSWLQLAHSKFFRTVAVRDRNQLRNKAGNLLERPQNFYSSSAGPYGWAKQDASPFSLLLPPLPPHLPHSLGCVWGCGNSSSRVCTLHPHFPLKGAATGVGWPWS